MFNDFTIYLFQIFQDLLRIPNTFQSDIITAVIALFVVIDPIGNIPLFIALTKKLEKEEQNTISKTAIITAGILLVIFGVVGYLKVLFVRSNTNMPCEIIVDVKSQGFKDQHPNVIFSQLIHKIKIVLM